MLNWDNVIDFADKGNLTPPKKVEKEDHEWKAELPFDIYYITRKKGTEPAHSSAMCSFLDLGKYACACCDTLLFDSSQKFASSSGWPSFTQPIEPNHVGYHLDRGYGMTRIESTCNICDAHLGHVFPDGPAPNGLRFCINALALKKLINHQ